MTRDRGDGPLSDGVAVVMRRLDTVVYMYARTDPQRLEKASIPLHTR
jgi:hypothetical protein